MRQQTASSVSIIGRGRIVGATVVTSDAGDLISAIALVMRYGGTYRRSLIGGVPVPNHLLIALRQAGDVYRRSALTPRVRKALRDHFQVLR